MEAPEYMTCGKVRS